VPRIRVLIVDDSAVIRRLVADELSADPAIEVVGTASDGKIALARLPQVNPDLVILDIEMPVMDGLTALREIRKTYPRLPVIMFSALTERGASATLDALALGATDYFTKPTGAGGLEASLKVIREELIPEIKALCPRVATPPAPPVALRPLSARAGTIDVIAIATSTGGPNALAEVFAGLPADLPVPVVMVQHMPAMFTRLLAERLTTQYKVPVEEGRPGGVLRPGHAWVAPGDFHMVVVRDGVHVKLRLNQDPPENSCRPAADVLFRSVAQVFGPTTLAVVLTGMGQDGLRGCEAIRAAGGQVIVQNEGTSVVWGMPGAVARAGLADKVLPLAEIAPEVVRRIRSGRGTVR
jgi:two-component system, chemotaxis family, protein-glutamate methylesterase/glutaminase